MSNVILVKSPLNGWVLPISGIPDPVFAQGLAGDGVAINPTGSTLCSPCDGIIISSHKTPHALSISSDSGLELLMHIGIDTVLLKGSGFKVLVTDGDQVKTGQALVEFDLEFIAENAASTITPVLFTSGNGKILNRCINKEVAIGDILFEIEPNEELQEAAIFDTVQIQEFIVTHEQGLHARPAAQLAAILRNYKAKVSINFESKTANARSMVSVMSLGIKHQDTITIEVSGIDNDAVLAELFAFFASNAPQHHAENNTSNPLPVMPENGVLTAVIASRGLATGYAYQLVSKLQEVEKQGKGSAIEKSAFEKALNQVSVHINHQIQSGGSDKHGILEAHAELIQDPTLYENCTQFIEQGFSAAYAWQQAISSAIATFNATDNAYMRARVADLRDIEQQMLKVLSGQDLQAKKLLPANCIIITDELLPSDLLSFDCNQIAGICSSGGGASAHAAIIAASMGIPFLVAAGLNILQIENGAHLILDAVKGRVHCKASTDEIKEIENKVENLKIEKITDLASAHLSVKTKDDIHVNIFCNLGDSTEVENALKHGADGCGLLRTEFMFLDRQYAPTEQEQYLAYLDFLQKMPHKVLTIRTMDIGGDKPIPYLDLPDEENPALGLRGIRTSLWREQLFIDQIRAILRLPQPNLVRILLPMINDVVEVETALKLINQCANDLDIKHTPPLGIMIETPASAMLSDQLLNVVEFISIGSNDLSQYVLAIDRGHPELASKLDALHPAVLRMIKHVAKTATLAKKKVSLCGGLASDPLAIPILIGLGVYELSAVPSMVPRIKKIVRSYSLIDCEQLANKAVNEKDAVSVRLLVNEFNSQFEKEGLL